MIGEQNNNGASAETMGQFAGNYIVEHEVGRGGAGRVLLAFDGNIGREVAIKEVDLARVPDESVRERRQKRFIREAKVTGQLEHPSIVPVYDFAMRPDGSSYYVMKYVRGKTLLQAIKEASAPTSEEGMRNRMRLVDCLADVCEAIAYAHAKGVIHRDLKPGNIVVGEFGETIILDWGLAKCVSDGENPIGCGEDDIERDFDDALTRQGALMGTPSFMAPEQADPKFGEVDRQSDVYALGALLFFILTGQRIYEPGGREALVHLTGDAPTPSPRERIECVPPELAAICEKATAKDKTRRFRDAREMAEELRAYRDGRLVSVYAYSRRELFARFVARNKAAAVATVALVIAIVAGGAFSVNFGIEAQRARLQAERALVDITSITDRAMSIARDSADRLQERFQTLSDSMDAAAARLAHAGAINRTAAAPLIGKLHAQHSAIGAFFVLSPDGRIVALAPADFEREESTRRIIADAVSRAFSERRNVLSREVMVHGRYAVVFAVPVVREDGVIACVAALVELDSFMPQAFGFDPVKSPFHVWAMEDDGHILYDEDSRQIGKVLFTDDMYQSFPELLALGKRMQDEPWGSGYYSFFDEVGGKVIYKIAAWDTLKLWGTNWKIVVTHPYAIGR